MAFVVLTFPGDFRCSVSEIAIVTPIAKEICPVINGKYILSGVVIARQLLICPQAHKFFDLVRPGNDNSPVPGCAGEGVGGQE